MADEKSIVKMNKMIHKKNRIILLSRLRNLRDKNMGLLVQFLTTFTSHLICTPLP